MRKMVPCDTIGDLANGAARLIVDSAIREAVFDLDDRGGDGKPRKVDISLEFKLHEDVVICSLEVANKAPRKRTGATVCEVGHDRGQMVLQFQSAAPDDARQRTIDEVSYGDSDGGEG